MGLFALYGGKGSLGRHSKVLVGGAKLASPWDVADSIEAENTGNHPFSLERELYHETLHGTQPEANEYFFNKSKYEDSVIEETNSFMEKYYGEPHRGRHDDNTFIGTRDRLNYSCP